MADISDVEWQTSSFDALVLPARVKDTVMTLAKARSTVGAKDSDLVPFDDFVAGKGRGLNILLQ